MALGFAFNKTKVLQSAERFVMQGKLQNAIAEYEKILTNDPKDLSVQNTLGDLYFRVGRNDAALQCFKKVADAYANDGFAVKAIAMYKKILKSTPGAVDCMTRLAELYSSQGLFSDARAQYSVLAEHHLKSNNTEAAIAVLRKTLEFDPENAVMQQRLADLYIKTKRKKEAADIYIMAAQSMQIRGNFAGAHEALDKVLKIDPSHAEGLQLRAKVSSESGDHGKAAQSLKSMPDLDSRPDALRQLLRTHVAGGDLEGAEKVANKLARLHNDPAAIRGVAEAWFAKDQIDRGIRLLEQYADELVTADKAAIVKLLQAAVAKAKQNAPALEQILGFYNRAGERGNAGEVMELLAHEYTETGELQHARDLYKQLSDLEPENPQHKQNFAQINARLGGGTATTAPQPTKAAAPTPKPVAQAPAAEPEWGITHPVTSSSAALPDFDKPLSQLKQQYTGDTAEAIENALTDSDLFQSYNSIPKAITPLEAVLPIAPEDTRVNERLAQLYIRTERFAEAVDRLEVLRRVFAAAGMEEDAQQCAVLAQTCRTRGGLPTPRAAAAAVAAASAAAASDTTVERVFSPESASEAAFRAERLAEAEAEEKGDNAPAELPAFEVASNAAANELFGGGAANPHNAVQDAAAWESAPAVEPQIEPEIEPGEPDRLTDALDEARFYISQGMRPEAQAALDRCAEIAPQSAEVTDLKAQLARMTSAPAAPAFAVTPAEPLVEPTEAESVEVEIEVEADEVAAESDDSDWGEVVEEAEEVVAKLSEPELPIIEPEEPPRKGGKEKAPEKEKHAATKKQTPTAEKTKHAPAKKDRETPVADFDDARGKQPGFDPIPEIELQAELEALPDLEDPATEPAPEPLFLAVPESLGAPIEPIKPVASRKPAEPSAPRKESKKKKDEEFDLASELDASLGENFSFTGETKPAKRAPVEEAPQRAARKPETSYEPAARSSKRNGARATNGDAEDLGSLLNEFTAEEHAPEDDLETRYNMGVALKDMGLLDEAIGELQKVCKELDRGAQFRDSVQAYTWLAHCLLEKGAPQAACKWYKRALAMPDLDPDSQVAIHYELGRAYEQAGSPDTALEHFMEAYSSNIDYRDVAERIEALRG